MSIPVREASDDVPAAKSGSDGLVRPPAGPLRPAPRNPWDPARSSCSWATVNGASGHTLGSGSRRLLDCTIGFLLVVRVVVRQLWKDREDDIIRACAAHMPTAAASTRWIAMDILALVLKCYLELLGAVV